MSRETLLTKTLVQLTESLVTDFDLVELLTMLSDRSVEILDVAAAGIMLASTTGSLQRLASSSEAMRVMEVFEEETDEGPCPDSFRGGQPVINVDLTQASARWPRFAPRALALGFRSVHALPMRVRDTTIGAMNLFRINEGKLGDADIAVAQALTDVATISIVTQRAAADAQALNEQLQTALKSRITIEQAKGVIAESLGVDMDMAFTRLRGHARTNSLKLGDVATAVAQRILPPSSLG